MTLALDLPDVFLTDDNLYLQGPLLDWAFSLYICLAKYKHLITEDTLQNYALFFFLCLLHHL